MPSEVVAVIDHNTSIVDMFKYQGGFVSTKQYTQASIVVFPGGADIDPQLYGERPLKSTNFNPKLDDRDTRIWEVIGGNKDVLKIGICRGAQFLNVMNGGKLWQHVDGHTKSHDIIDLVIAPGEPLHVTSTHHQMMIPSNNGVLFAFADKLGSNFKTDNPDLKKSEKNFHAKLQPKYEAEVVYYPETNCLCFQPHPEYDTKDNSGRLYFFDLIDAILWGN